MAFFFPSLLLYPPIWAYSPLCLWVNGQRIGANLKEPSSYNTDRNGAKQTDQIELEWRRVAVVNSTGMVTLISHITHAISDTHTRHMSNIKKTNTLTNKKK